jgi:hypothetical protein
MEGRAVARVFDATVTRGGLRDRGWTVGELNDPAMVLPYRGFSSLAEARACAARDLPAGTAVGWASADGFTVGGFVVGDDTVAPPIADRFPAFVLWPDATEDEAASNVELSTVLRGRMDWLCQLAIDRGLEPAEITSGRAEAEQALEVLASTGRLNATCCGPKYHVLCAARLQPVALVRWDGFRAGWERPDGPPTHELRHPVHPEHSGSFLRCWRDGFQHGVEARRRRAR